MPEYRIRHILLKLVFYHPSGGYNLARPKFSILITPEPKLSPFIDLRNTTRAWEVDYKFLKYPNDVIFWTELVIANLIAFKLNSHFLLITVILFSDHEEILMALN